MVEIECLSKTFHPGEVNEVAAVDDVTLTIPDGQFLVIIGGNGSGKSTLLNLVAGALIPDRGRISISGRDVTRVPEYRRAGLIGRVFQDPMMGTAVGLTIDEHFALAARRGAFRGLSPALDMPLRHEIRDRLALLGMGLENRMGTKVGLLSGGQRQALTLLMAVFRRPKILLLDEHTAALDPRASREIMRLTRDIILDQELTTLMVTHNLSHALDSGHRTVVMSRGRVVRDLDAESLAKLTIQDLMALFLECQQEVSDQA